MVVKKAAAAERPETKVAPGFEGGEPLTLSNSRGLKSALKFFVKIGLFLEFRRTNDTIAARRPHTLAYDRSRAGLETEGRVEHPYAFDPLPEEN